MVLSDKMAQALYPMLRVWKVEMVRRNAVDYFVDVVVVVVAVAVDVIVPCLHDSFFSTLD